MSKQLGKQLFLRMEDGRAVMYMEPGAGNKTTEQLIAGAEEVEEMQVVSHIWVDTFIPGEGEQAGSNELHVKMGVYTA